MITLQPRRKQRKSLLAISREQGGESSVSLWKTLLIAHGALLALVAIWSLFMETGEEFALAILLAVIYCTPITLIAYYASGIVRRISGQMPKVIRGALLVATWMMSGVIGSCITYATIFLVSGGNAPFPAALFNPILIGNGVVAVGVGTFIFFFDLFNNRYQVQTELQNQQDLLTAEFQAARNVQRSLLPAEDVRIIGFDISGTTEPAVEIGGDYYDYLSFADGTKGILIADAAGKGVPAALVMAKFQGMTQALSMQLASPNEFLSSLDDTLKLRLDRRSFITVGMLTIDLNDRCAFYRAGHNPLLLYRAATGCVESCRPPGLALGLTIGPLAGTIAANTLQPAWFTMSSGDVALLYSDGLDEATNATGDAFEDERVMEALRDAAAGNGSALEIRTAVLSALAHFVGSAEPHDDITIVVVRKL